MDASTRSPGFDRTHLADPLLHFGLARSIAKTEWKRHPIRYCTYEDFEQTAYVGLLDACKRYDPERGTFASFATPTILGYISKLRGSKRIVNFGSTKIGRIVARCLKYGNVSYNPDYTSMRMEGVSGAPHLRNEVEVHRAVGFARGSDMYLEDIYTPPNLTFEEILEDDSHPENIPFEKLVGERWVRELELYRDRVECEGSLLKKLLLNRRLFVLEAEDQATLADIGREVGVSRERVRQIESRMIAEIRQLVRGIHERELT